MRGLERMQQETATPLGTLCNTRSSFAGRLKEEKKQLEERLANINEVLKSLDKSPEVANVLEALNKLNY